MDFLGGVDPRLSLIDYGIPLGQISPIIAMEQGSTRIQGDWSFNMSSPSKPIITHESDIKKE